MPIPFGMALLAALLCAIRLAIDCAAWQGDIALPQWLSVGDVDDARALLSAILGSVSTVLALIFSVSLLVFPWRRLSSDLGSCIGFCVTGRCESRWDSLSQHSCMP